MNTADLEKILEEHKKDCWIPVTARASRQTNLLVLSRFGGTPDLAVGFDWPACGYCEKPLALLAQVDLAETPKEALSAFDGKVNDLQIKILQVFACKNDETECYTQCGFGGPDDLAMHARFIPRKGLKEREKNNNEDRTWFPERPIVSWTAKRGDYPSFQFLAKEELVSFEGDDLDNYVSIVGEDGDDNCKNFGRDKLSGWPADVQECYDYECQVCHGKMMFLFQIDSEDHVPHSFGDGGRGWAYVCPEDFAVAFYWECS